MSQSRYTKYDIFCMLFDKKEGELFMMYMHFCSNCKRIHMLTGHKVVCPTCGNDLVELRISFMEYVSLSEKDRDILLRKCQDPHQLPHLKTTYRMMKYSKWYQNLNSTVKH